MLNTVATTEPAMSEPAMSEPAISERPDGAASNAADAPGDAGTRIADLRQRIDEIDATIIELWRERAQISQQVGAARIAAGGTRLALAREREILDKFHAALGTDGTQLGLLLLRAGRGRL